MESTIPTLFEFQKLLLLKHLFYNQSKSYLNSHRDYMNIDGKREFHAQNCIVLQTTTKSPFYQFTFYITTTTTSSLVIIQSSDDESSDSRQLKSDFHFSFKDGFFTSCPTSFTSLLIAQLGHHMYSYILLFTALVKCSSNHLCIFFFSFHAQASLNTATAISVAALK